MAFTVSDQINERLAKLEVAATHTERTLDSVNEILRDMRDVMQTQAVTSEKLVRVHERLDQQDKQIENIALQVDKNKSALAKWGGGLIVVSTVAGWFGKDLIK